MAMRDVTYKRRFVGMYLKINAGDREKFIHVSRNNMYLGKKQNIVYS